MKVFLSFLLVFGLTDIALGDNCANRFQEYVRAAQRLDDDTPALSKQMHNCAAFNDEVIYWLQYYHTARGEHDRVAEIGRSMRIEDFSAQTSERMEVLSAAKRGQYRSLQDRVKTGRTGYADDAESLLILARASIRDRRYLQGRDVYDKYSLLKPDDWEIRLERTLTYVWSGEKNIAQAELERVVAKESNEEYRNAARAALAQIVKNSSAEYQSGPQLLGAIERYRTSDQYDRTTSKLAWDNGRYQFTLLSHEVESTPFDIKTELLGTELSVGGHFSIGRGFVLHAVAGAFLAKESKGIYDGRIEYQRGKMQLSLGTLQQSLARYLPLLKEDFSMMDRAQYIDIQYAEWFRYRAEYHQIREYEPFQKHNLVLRRKILAQRFNDTDTRLRGGVQYEAHERPSPLYYSPKQSTLGFVGLEHKTKLSNELEVHMQYDRGIVFFLTRAPSKAEKKIQYYVASLDAKYSLNDEFVVFLAGHYSQSYDQELSLSVYQSNRIELGVLWSYDKPNNGG